MFKFLLLLTVILCSVTVLPKLTAAAPLVDPTSKMSSAQFEANLPRMHPAVYYQYAQRLFDEGRRDDAVFWFYVGQLRYRFYLSANPTLPDSDPALFVSLNATVGQEINEYAGGAPATWIAAIDRALAWDMTSPNYFTSKEHFHKEYIVVRSGLIELKKMIQSQAQEIRTQRTKSGLPNR